MITVLRKSALVAPWLAVACGALRGGDAGPVSPTRPADCRTVSGDLRALAEARDPSAHARQAGLDLDASGVRVVVALLPGAAVPSGYGLVVEGRTADVVQARVAPDRLCALGGALGVVVVRAPLRPEPQSSP